MSLTLDRFSDRRSFLKAALTGSAGLYLSHAGFALAADNSLTTTALGNGVMLISGAGANVVVASGPDGMVMVDTGLPQHASRVLKVAAAQSPARKIQAAFNTNWRAEHTGANEALGKAGVKIYAHENTKLWMGADFFIEWKNETHEPAPKIALPTDTFYTSGKMAFGKETIQYAHLEQASTDGDIYVFFPESNVLVVSDLLAVGTYPLVDYSTGGWVRGMAKASKALMDIADDKTRVIPAHGPVQSKADLKSQYEMCNTIDGRIGDLMKQGKSVDEVIAARPTKEFDAAHGDPEHFLRLAYKGAWGHIREYHGVI